MKILLNFVFCLVFSGCQFATAQVLHPPYNLINRPGIEKIIEAGQYIPSPTPVMISEPAINSFVPVLNRESYSIPEPSTTIITDCSPTICKNLVNTIQLMMVCNLLQNKGSSEMALQLARPIVNEVLSTSPMPCGCADYISPNLPNLISPNVISPRVISPNVVSPNFIPANVPISNIIGQKTLPLTPTVATPTSIYPNTFMPISSNVPTSAQIANKNDFLNALVGLLGNVKM